MLKSLHDYSKNELISIINDLRKRKKFGMVWEDKPEQAVEDCKSKLPVVREVESRSIELVEDAPTSLIIEGDNYHALKVLNYTHAGKIDVIYIDPPYNTGNQDFIYNDNYVDIDDDYRHSKWLCFMKRRLLLAKDLLAQDGVIFISIDDNEQARLKILCDQIFRERNFINCISVKSSETSGVKMSHIEKKLPKIKEYLLVYANNSESIKLNPITIPKSIDKKKFVAYSKYYSKIITNPDDVPEEWEIIPIKKYLKENGIVLDNEDELLNFKIEHADRLVYRTNNATLANLSFDTKTARYVSPTGLNYVWWEGKQMLFFADYLEEALCDLWIDISTINLNKEITGLPQFSNGQKPLALLQRLIMLTDNSERSNTILDFFAGSGTTGHAVLELNKEDGGNRQFILCTNNENQIAEEVTYPRIKNVIEGYADVEGIPANLRYFKTAFVDKGKTTDQTRVALVERATDMIRIRENTFNTYEAGDDFSIFTNGKSFTIIILDPLVIDEVKETIKQLPGDHPVNIYIFSLSNDTYQSDFLDLDHEIQICPIPESILEVYQRICKAEEDS